ncbi:hypothetical protein LIER_20207 [Lithospermum erythrorhizon]|uniref:Reverse transcriptase zinc-binding domain-containing protein n=1 Tax=Lithospermum erythrorhizon TaxID=34254 RepID=A0AAV3QKM2_LITER
MKCFFATGRLARDFNATTITLIPKKQCPLTMKDYRPIACCNVIYKCVSKILADRMKGILGDVISSNQSEFMKGMLIRDNIMYIKSLLKEFGELARLVPNLEKSNIFVGGGNVEMVESLSRFMNIPIGILPIRYLGVPLTSKKMSRNDYKVLVDKIRERLQGWKLRNFSTTIWVKWVNTVRLKGKSIWAYKKASKDSWVWKSLWKHREWLYQFVEIKCGDGKDTLIWSDPWLEGKYFEDWPENIKEKLVHLVTLTVADVKAGTNGWRWPTGRRLTRKVQVLKDKVDMVVLDPASKDWMEWKSIPKERSVVRRIYKTLVEPGRKERWAKVVWFWHNVPRHSFILWLLVLERLETRDRVAKWKNGCELKCLFCDENESRNHVFFQCNFSGNMWRHILKG